MGHGESADNIKKRRGMGEWVVTVRGIGQWCAIKACKPEREDCSVEWTAGVRDAGLEREATAEKEEMRPFVLSGVLYRKVGKCAKDEVVRRRVSYVCPHTSGGIKKNAILEGMTTRPLIVS